MSHTTKAISLWQPWASAIALGSKRIETRSWPTKYRGPLAIHAAKRCNKGEMLSLQSDWQWVGALHPFFASVGHVRLSDSLPFGAIVAVAMLTDCRKTESFTIAEIEHVRSSGGYGTWTERQMGDFSPGRYGWILEGVIPMKTPLPWNGSQGFFEVPTELLREATNA